MEFINAVLYWSILMLFRLIPFFIALLIILAIALAIVCVLAMRGNERCVRWVDWMNQETASQKKRRAKK
jgi:predicted membrane protein